MISKNSFRSSKTQLLVGLAVGLVAVLAAYSIPAISNASPQTVPLENDWPPLTMIYDVGTSDESGAFKWSETRRLEYRSRVSWTDTLLSTEDIETAYGTFSEVGSFQEFENGVITTYNAVTDHTSEEKVETGTMHVPSFDLMAVPLEDRVGAGEATASLTREQALVAFCDSTSRCRDQVTSVKLVGTDGIEMTLLDDPRGIPLSVGNRLKVRELTFK